MAYWVYCLFQSSRCECVIKNYALLFLNQNICCVYSKEPSLNQTVLLSTLNILAIESGNNLILTHEKFRYQDLRSQHVSALRTDIDLAGG